MKHFAGARSFKNVTLQTALAAISVIFFMVMGLTNSVYAQARDASHYPERPIKIVVGFVPGGPTDLYARVAARGLSDALGQQVVVENKPGASGAIAAVAVAGAAADGYTLLAHVVSDIITPLANKKVGYNLERDFTAIGLIASAPNVLVVHPSIPANSVQELIAYAKKNPNTLVFGNDFSRKIFANTGSMKLYQRINRVRKTLSQFKFIYEVY
jgi:tripartite-type tricarboxylate transporter receptor subunit TctC